MKRFFDVFNLLGIGVMVWLCIVQWTANGQLGRQVDHLESVRQQQTAMIQTQNDTIRGQAEDLDDFRTRLETAETQLRDLALKLSKVTTERDRVTAERDRLKTDLDQWIAAVKGRDALIKQAGDEIQLLAKQRNAVVEKFNDLAGKYNAMVKKEQGGQ